MTIRLLCLLTIIYSGNVLALGDPITNEEQLHGCWKRHIYADDVMSSLSTFELYDPVNQKYQWFCFFQGGKFAVHTTNKDVKVTVQEIEKFRAPFPSVMSWKLIGMGLVKVEHKEDPAQNANWLVSLAPSATFLRDGAPVYEGDLFMGLLNKEQSRYALLRVLSRVQ
jgi:hypothetical protein